MKHRVVVTGIGIICAQGIGVEAVWGNCMAMNAVVGQIPERWKNFASFNSIIWAPLPSIDYSNFGITRLDRLRNDPVTLITYAATLEALRNAKLLSTVDQNSDQFKHGLDPLDTAIMLGTGLGGVNSMLSNHTHHLIEKQKKSPALSADQLAVFETFSAPNRINPFVVSMVMPNAPSAVLGIKFQIQGPNKSYSVACASGTVAIGEAYRAIQNGLVSSAITGGCEYLNDDYGAVFKSFDIAGVLVNGGGDPYLANRPFDKAHNGFLFGEGGAAILVLEQYEHALKRGAPMLAEIVGYAETFDAYNILNPDPESKMAEEMLRLALQDASLTVKDIDLINSHGTGTSANDVTEAKMILRVFGDTTPVNATKSITGHTIGASGAIEAAITALSLHNQQTHGCCNLENPIEDLNFLTASKNLELSSAVSYSFAFGGHNAALVMNRID